MTQQNSEKDLQYAKKLADLIRIETVSSDHEVDLKKYEVFHDALKEMFPLLHKTAIVEDFDGSLLFRWIGKSPEHPVLFMNHHDVVEAEGEWLHPPFAGVVEGGRLYGRGTLDTKGGLFCMLQAAEELIAEGFVPERDIYFESARTEECNGDGAENIARELVARGVHFDWSLDEGGMIVCEPIAGAKGAFGMIAVGEKGCSKLKFVARSAGGHASRPPKNTPLVRLGRFMAATEKARIFPSELSPVVKEMFRRVSRGIKGPMRFVLGHAALFSPLLARVLPAVSPAAGALVKTTVAFTMASGSEANNVLPQEAYVIGDMRFSHHQGGEASVTAIRDLAKKYDVQTEVIEEGISSPLSDFKSEGFEKIERATRAVFPDVTPTPYISMSASDNRFMHIVADQCFGFVPFRVSDEQLASVHGVNENVDVSCLSPAVEFYKFMMR